MTPASDTTTFSELSRNLRDCLDRLKKTGRPLYVTTDGSPDAVVLSPQMFEQLLRKAEHMEDLAGVQRGMDDVNAGRSRDFREGIRAIADELGLKLDR